MGPGVIGGERTRVSLVGARFGTGRCSVVSVGPGFWVADAEPVAGPGDGGSDVLVTPPG